MMLAGCGGSGAENTSATPSPEPSTPPPTTAPGTLQDIAEIAAQSVDGIVIYVEQRGEEPRLASAGIKDRSNQSAFGSDALFKIASISKLFIAVAATKLVNEGAMDMQDNLHTWLPEYSTRIANAEQVTLLNLIQHRSGIPDFDSQSGFSWLDPHTDIDNTLAFALDKPADFAPDSRYEYSNTNYLLLAKVMDRVLGFSHQQYIIDYINNPLNLLDTHPQYSDLVADALVSGYWENTNRKQQDYVIPGGSMIATASDIGIFIRALNTGSLLTDEEKRIYPYWYQHSGWLPGYQSIANYYADIDAVVVVFINTTGYGSENIASSTLSQILSLLRAE